MELFSLSFFSIAVVLTALFGLLYVYLTWNYGYWKKRGVPHPKPELFFGTIRDTVLFRMSEGHMLEQLYNQLEGHKFGGGFQFRTPFFLIKDPEIIKSVLVKDFAHFHDRGIPVDEENVPLSAHLFGLEGPRWRALRAKLSPTFTSGKMKMMYHLITQCSEELRKHLEEPARLGKQLEMREVLAQFTTDIIGTCAFGLQINSMENSDNEFRRMGRKVFESSPTALVKRLIAVFCKPLAKVLNFKMISDDITNFFLNVVKDTVSYREKNDIKRNDFLQLLIQIKNMGRVEDDDSQNEHNESIADEIKMTESLMAAQVFVFFLAGFETSSTTMSFALYELALNPDIQERLRQEVDAVSQKYGGKITYEGLQDMQYLDKVVSESLRKYPPASNLIRKCTIPYTIPGTDITLEKGTKLFVSTYGLHHDPKYYPDPDRFDPERFSEETKASRHHYSYLPFGEGPRICIGMRFGLMQAKAGLASLLQSYEFSPCERTTIPMKYDPFALVTASINGIWLKITPRK